ncbi:MAG: Grx4 family monothiol glutaredoxin [Polyangiaceae bacterium]|jgi:monothiol glutaredoxin
MDETLRKRIAELVSKNDVLLFMKGTRHFPQCGFSSQVVGILNELGPKYETVNILAEAELRDGMKEFSSWPTFPQLYVKGSFVGGCDIVREMHANGELGVLFGAEAPKPPKIAVTEGAARAFKDALSDAGQDVLRLEITPEFQYDLHVGPREPSDIEIQTDGGVTLFVEAASARRADGLRIDFVTNGGGGFKLDNPNEPPRVKTMDVEGLKSWLDKRARGEAKLELLDVRPERERALAKIDGAKMLDHDVENALAAGDRDTMLVFHCHHGMRSRAAAEHFLKEGFRNVWNVEGGIDAWSLKVDPSVARY